MEMHLTLESRGKNTFHLDGELPQLFLQLRFDGTHVLRVLLVTPVDLRQALPGSSAGRRGGKG